MWDEMTASVGSVARLRALGLARKSAKVAVLPLGLPGRRRPGDVTILAYHRVGEGRREIDLPRRSFNDQLAYLADHEGVRVRALDEALTHRDGGVVLTFDDGYRDFIDHVLPLLVRYQMPATLYLATGLVEDGGGPADPPPLTWSMLRDAVATGLVSIGSHTHDHANLSRATDDAADSEMRRSKELIEDQVQTPCRHFAYPWGVGSPGADRAARRRFDTAALDGWRTNRRGRIDPHRLGRTPILRSDGPFFFRAKTRGLLDSEAMVYRAMGRGPWGQT
jgi:peptidoglycan/xylan/chitin deacetylase (PgdA/CDA1 family)